MQYFKIKIIFFSTLPRSEEDLSASFTRSFQRGSLARQSMSLKRNKLSNGNKDSRLEKLYAKVKEVRQKGMLSVHSKSTHLFYIHKSNLLRICIFIISKL